MWKHAILSTLITLSSFIVFAVGPSENTATQDLLAQVQLNELLYHVAWSPDGQLLAVASDSGVRIYTDNLRQIALLQGHTTNAVGWVAWNPEGTELISLGQNDSVPHIWSRDLSNNTFNLLLTLPPSDPIYEYVRAASWSPGGTKLALVRLHQPDGFLGVLGITQIYDTQTWQVENTLEDELPFPARDIEWSADSSKIASAYYTCDTPDSRPACDLPTFYVADIDTGKILWKQDDLVVTYDLAWSDNKLAIDASGVQIYDPMSGQRLQTWDIDGPDTDVPLYMDWNSDETRLVVANQSGLVDVLDAQDGATLVSFQTIDFPQGITSLDWNSSGNKLALGSRTLIDQVVSTVNKEATIQIWSVSEMGKTITVPTSVSQ